MSKQHKFRVKLIGQEGSSVAAFRPPFDVPKAFGRTGRVPIKGTINGFPFRSSLMNMGEGHMTVVNAEMRAGAKCKAGDMVEVAIELDEAERTVDAPAWLMKLINAEPATKAAWAKLSFTHRKEYVREITGAKKEETREKRVSQMLDNLRTGKQKS
jgi:hypothetical protein